MFWGRKQVDLSILSPGGEALLQGALSIISTLTEGGYEAYIVGGAVRDLLRKQEPKDYDIVTSARPEVVMDLLSPVVDQVQEVGLSFAVVLARCGTFSYEIASYRGERYGEGDSHRPEAVWFVDSLREDVERRDFTVNGMALDGEAYVIDYVGGIKDCKAKRLRCIGQATRRFQEDSLRLFRACRFLGQLGFEAHGSLVEGMAPAFSRVAGLAQNRVRVELEKLMLSPHVAKGLDLLVRSGLADQSCSVSEGGESRRLPILPELSHLVDVPQEKAFHVYDAWVHSLAVTEATAPDLTLRWAALFHDVAKGMPGVRAIRNGRMTDYGHDAKGAVMAYEALRRLGYGDKMAKEVEWLVANHMRYHYYAMHEEADAHKWLRREARSGLFHRREELAQWMAHLQALCVADVIGCGRPNSSTAGTEQFGHYLQDLIAQSMAIHTRDLQYPPTLVKEAGANTGYILRKLLRLVQDRQLDNEAEALLAKGRQMLAREQKVR